MPRCCLFERPHHQRILKLLGWLDARLLAEHSCYFGGGTAIVLQLGEYRESVAIDLLCASHEGYRFLRNAVSERSLGLLSTETLVLPREVRSDRYGIRTFCMVDGTPIKFEIVREDRIELGGAWVPGLPIQCLSRTDLYAEKLLAHTDRWADRSTLSRDLIDLAMMVHHWGPIPDEAWAKARDAYGASVDKALQSGRDLVASSPYLHACLLKMGMLPTLAPVIQAALGLAGSDPAA